MQSLFVRSLALASSSEAHFVVGASRTTSDGTFAVASLTDGIIRVYAASCAALLHEFTTIHRRIYALHYTSFSDSLVTLESDTLANDEDDELVETFLCVYHDWRERKMVRGYTLPLGVLENPTSKKKSDCVAVCSFTGRVVVAMGTVLNIWQCSAGFFEHVMEIKVDMSQQHAYLSIEYVAIHGVYIAYASQTEVRVMEIHVRNTKESTNMRAPTQIKPSATKIPDANGIFLANSSHSSLTSGRTTAGEEVKARLPIDSMNCFSLESTDDLNQIIEIPVPSPAYNMMENEKQFHIQQQNHQEIKEEQDVACSVPVVLRRSEAQQEVWHLAGLVRDQDIRVNQALSYFVAENDVTVLLRRFLPPNNCIQSLKFLPETIDNRICIESRSYTRLLVATEQHAFLYYFLSTEVDSTRKKMSRKVLGKAENTVSRSTRHTRLPIRMVSPRKKYQSTGKDVEDKTKKVATGFSEEDNDETTGRVVMHYHFHVPATCITANSSFLFVSTLTGLQVWSIWSPCHHVAASRALSHSLVPKPTQPQLLCVHPLPFPAAHIAALDTYVILLPLATLHTRTHLETNLLRIASSIAEDNLPDDCLEMRGLHDRKIRFKEEHGEEEEEEEEDQEKNVDEEEDQEKNDDDEEEKKKKNKLHARNVLILQQSPPSLIFSYARQTILKHVPEKEPYSAISENQVDLLLSLFSLYRYRADVGQSLLRQTQEGEDVVIDSKDYLALELETKLYDSLAKECAADLAMIFLASTRRNLKRAALLFAASNIPAKEILKKFQHLLKEDPKRSKEVMEAIGKFLEAFLFPFSSSSSFFSASAFGGTAANGGECVIMGRKQSASSSSKESDTQSFTRAVLNHYVEYSPKQLAHLVIDSSLEWTLEDMQFALEQLQESAKNIDIMVDQVDAFVSIEIAVLVLLLRANSVYSSTSRALNTSSSTSGKVISKNLESLCSYTNVREQAEKLFANHQESLLELCVHHPELLALSATDTQIKEEEGQKRHHQVSSSVLFRGNENKKKKNGSTLSASATSTKEDKIESSIGVTTNQQSVLAKALLEISPSSFEMIIERIFHNSLLYCQKPLLATVVYCLSMFGDHGKASANRIMTFLSISTTTSAKSKQSLAPFGLFQLSLVRFLWFLLSLFPTFEEWMEKEDIQEEEEELRVIEEAIAMEYIHLVVESCNYFLTPSASSSTSSKHLELLFDELLEQLKQKSPTVGDVIAPSGRFMLQHLGLADWIKEFIEVRCIHASVSRNIRHILRYLFYQSLLLVDREPIVVKASKILKQYEAIISNNDDNRNQQNDLALVMVLVSLPKCHRTMDGLNLIAKREATCFHLFLPYGQCFCQTLEEWRFLIETLTTISSRHNGKEKEEEKVTILENILNHVCLTLGPKDLLQVLPDQGDLALYIATLENSIRLEETKVQDKIVMANVDR